MDWQQPQRFDGLACRCSTVFWFCFVAGPSVYQGVAEVKTKTVQGVEVHLSSGNVFADLGLADADKLKIKTGLVIEIRKALNRLALTQQEAAKRMGISQPKVSDMMRGNFANLSERKLMDCLTRLGYDIEIKDRPAKTEMGHLRLALA
jgi:predicted XRE-type DNA-binding protein